MSTCAVVTSDATDGSFEIVDALKELPPSEEDQTVLNPSPVSLETNSKADSDVSQHDVDQTDGTLFLMREMRALMLAFVL